MPRRLSNRERVTAAFIVLAAGCWWVSVQPARSAERVTDEEIQKLFGKQHALMEGEQHNLEALLGAFLNGEHEAIKRYSAIIAQDMNKVADTYPPSPRQQAAEWQAMADIITQAGLMQSKAEAGLLDEAYDHYAVMTKRCIACHQVRRSWGIFTEPGDASSVDEAAQIEQKTTNFMKKKTKPPAAQPTQSESSQQTP